MVTADTKDVNATERITYESEADSHGRITGIGNCVTEYTEQKMELFRQEKEEQEQLAVLKEEQPLRQYELSEADYKALVQLVEAEASGEDLKGKILVANVVLNRVKNDGFPDSVEEVVYQTKSGKAQFSPVANGRIHQVTVSEETILAVERALCGEDESMGALFFMARKHANPKNVRWFDEHLTWLFAHNGHEFYA